MLTTKFSSRHRKLILGMFGSIGLTAITVCVSLLQFRLLLHYLPIAWAGLWMIFINLGNYALLLDLGLSPTIGREISFAVGRVDLSESEKTEQVCTLVRSCTVAVSALALLLAIAGSSAGWQYLLTIMPVQVEARVGHAWFVFAIGAAMNLAGEGWFAGLYGLGHVFEEKLIRASGALLGIIFLFAALLSGQNFMAMACAFLLQSICTLLLARFMLHRLLGSMSGKGRFDAGILTRIAGPSLKYAGTVLGGILILQTDNLVIASLFGPARVPDYQAVSKIVTILMTLSMMLITTSAPMISQAHAAGDRPAIVKQLNQNLRFGLATMAILGSIVACFVDRLVAIWLGPGHFVGFPIVWVLLTVMLLEAHHLSMASATMAAGKIVFLAPALIAGVLNLCFSIVLAQRFGLVGVACGTLAAQVLTNNWFVPYYAMKLFHIPFAQHLQTVVLPALVLIGMMLPSGYALRVLTRHASPFVGLAIGTVFLAAVGITAAGMLLLQQEERAGMMRRLGTMFVRSRMTIATLLGV